MGVGRRLVEAVTGRADAEGVPCYLESSKGWPNLVIYQKMGFRVVREIECLDGWEACKVFSFLFPWEIWVMLTRVVVLHGAGSEGQGLTCQS